MAETKRPKGNPAWVKGGPSPNPSGMPRVAIEFRAKARQAVDDLVLDAWIDEVRQRGKEWTRCSENLAAYGYGKPLQTIDATVTQKVTEMTLEQLDAIINAEGAE